MMWTYRHSEKLVDDQSIKDGERKEKSPIIPSNLTWFMNKIDLLTQTVIYV